ncbi:AKAP7 2'5' RNA ligase-like domain-containing protein [Mycena vitilis]|nr:AKAP7 2'5' RNA ligase-like domain-containing protein [Mycena vitilis]
MGQNENDVKSPKVPKRAKRPQKPKPNAVRPRPTHFLSLPLGHHPELRERIKAFHHKLLPPDQSSSEATTPPPAVIEGLDRSILVDPRRLHLTIGVMTLASSDSETLQADLDSAGGHGSQGKTLEAAIALLRSLGPDIDAIVAPDPSTETTRAPVSPVLTLDTMGVLKTKRKQAGVLYVGPNDDSDGINEDTRKVTRLFDLVGRRFREEGFIDEDARPAVLHCTLINASHRKPRRVPRTFSYREIFEHASKLNETPAASAEAAALLANDYLSPLLPQDRAIRVDFGTWAISEVQLCTMGSHGPENEYVSVASVPVISGAI